MTHKNYEVYFFDADNPFHLEQWLQEKLDESNLSLIGFSGGYYVFEPVNLMVTGNGFSQDALSNYAEFYDKVMIALGYKATCIPCEEMDNRILKRISDMFWIVRNLYDALVVTYNKLPAHWRELPFSYIELSKRVKDLLRSSEGK